MATYREYLGQIEDLQKKATAARKAEMDNALREVRRLVAEFGLTAKDIGLEKGPAKAAAKPGRPGRKPAAVKAVGRPRGGARKSTAGKKVPPKYCGPNGELWTGRGRQPLWVANALNAGAKLDDFEIRSAQQEPMPA